jgi:hypothetical protein
MSKQKLKFKIKKKPFKHKKKKRSKSYVARAVAAGSVDADVSGLDGVAVSQCALFVGDAWSIDFTEDR